MATRIIGIDFGTSTTVVRVHNIGEENRIIPVAVNGQTTIPTIAFQPKDSNDIYYGYDAQAQNDSNIEGTLYRNFKMDLISDDEEKRKHAETLIEGFLKYVFVQYQSLLNDDAFDPADEVKVYVSHPAKWNSYARSLMKQSVEKAGFCSQENIALKDEPTAAILAVIHEKSAELSRAKMLDENSNHKAMMIDMGAGTTDIVLCSYMVVNSRLVIDDIFTYPSINTPGLCGGREIDDAIIAEAQRFVDKMQNKPSSFGNRVINKMRRNVKSWKEQTISSVLRRNSALPEPFEISEFRDNLADLGLPIMNEKERFSISRAYFEDFTHEHWCQWAELIKGAFDEAQGAQYRNLNCPKRPEEVELLIITGGHSQWYLVPEYLLGMKTLSSMPTINFSKIRENKDCLLQSVDPQETVAIGLCHLDEDIVGELAASNDVSMSFTCEGKYLGACDLIKKGVPLPFEKRDYLVQNTIKGNFIFRKEIKIDYDIITDGTNVISKSITVPSDSIIEAVLKALISTLGLALTTFFKLISAIVKSDFSSLDGSLLDEIKNTDYPVILSPDIVVNEEGIIAIGGTIIVDDEKLFIPEIVI